MGRSETARRRVLESALELLHATGLENFTVEAVAKHSGVAKTTIYRHWPDPDQLVVEALRSSIVPVPTPNSGSIEQDLGDLLHHLTPGDADELDRHSRLLFGVLQRAADHGELRDAIDELFRERFGPVRTIIELGQARGEIDPEIDLDIAVDLVIGPLLHRFLLRRRVIDAEDRTRMIHHVVRGLHP